MGKNSWNNFQYIFLSIPRKKEGLEQHEDE